MVHTHCPTLATALEETLDVSWHWPVGIIPWQGFWHKPYEVTMEPQIRAQLLLHTCLCISFNQSLTQAWYSKVKQKTCVLENKKLELWASSSYPEGSWMSPQEERLLLKHAKTPGFLASGGEEFNLGPETRLDRSELLCNKVLLKYKGDKESFWHRHQKWAERVPPASLQLDVIQSLAVCKWKKGMS